MIHFIQIDESIIQGDPRDCISYQAVKISLLVYVFRIPKSAELHFVHCTKGRKKSTCIHVKVAVSDVWI